MTFEQVWNEYIIPIEGKEIFLAKGGINKILKVTNKGITRITSRGNVNDINRDVIKYAFDRVKKDGYVSRKNINQKFPNRLSSGVIAILKEIPFIELTSEPELGLKLII
ncbi:MAG: hypothetical protein PHN41_06130 [Bacteroidales bacterium]|nr:hypothetical protein [Bacteroidales bacterium]